MRFLNVFFLLTIYSACFSSCATVPKNNRLFTNITDNAIFFLLPPFAIEQKIDMAQYVSAVFGGRNYFFVAWVKADKDAIEMALFNELGAGIGELSYREGIINFSSAVIPRAALRYIKPEYIVADFQLCFYSTDLLETALEECGLVLEINNGYRRILNGDEVIIEITKTNNSVSLKNNLRGYTYTMEGDFSGIK